VDGSTASRPSEVRRRAARPLRPTRELCRQGDLLAEIVDDDYRAAVDQLAAGVAAAAAQIEVLQAQQGQPRAALFQLAALLGRTPVNAPPEVQACVRPPGLRDLIPVGDGAALLKRRPDVRQADRRVAAATARIGIATADLYPKISLTGLIGGVSSELNELTTNKGITWGVGPSVTWTFPNAAAPRARVRQAKANAAAALAGFDAVVL
jgi:multidrug efflux system outer membrane protein